MAKEKKAKAPKPPKAPTSVEKLVAHALQLAATNPKAKWLGKSNKALFNTNEPNNQAALDECTQAERPLLRQVKDGGTLSAAGLERIAGELPEAEARAVFDRVRDELPEEQVGALAKALAAKITSPGKRAEFVKEVGQRTPLAIGELLPILREAEGQAQAETDARVALTAKRRAAEEASLQALDEWKQLIRDGQRARVAALKRELEAEGEKASELTEDSERDKPPLPKTKKDKDFRRDVADQLAAAWRAAWDASKHEARDYLESAMWNVSGLKLVGEPGKQLSFDGRYHECETPVFTDDRVKVVRAGWVLEEDEDRDHVALKAVVENA